MNTLDLSRVCVSEHASVREAAECVNSGRVGIALLIDEAGRLCDTVTDGDLRRGILAGVEFESLARDLKARAGIVSAPVVAPESSSREALLRLMREKGVLQIPLLGEDGRVVNLAVRAQLQGDDRLDCEAVVMAGGFGTRLRPLTEDLPKPMLPVGKRPLLEHVIDQLRDTGVQRVNITTHYRPEMIKEHFGDGQAFGIDLNYIDERQPLGTAGALALMEPSQSPILVVNGDVLTRVDYRAMLKFHHQHEAELTVGVRHHETSVPYGVVETEGPFVRSIQEKPTLTHLVNAGIYLLSPKLLEEIPSGERYDMTDLIEKLVVERRTVVTFPIIEYWLDIGRPDDYHQAQADVEAWDGASF